MNHGNTGLMLCADCASTAVNGDLPAHASDAEMERIETGLREFGTIVPNFDMETGENYNAHTLRTCSCCRLTTAGEYLGFLLLADVACAI